MTEAPVVVLLHGLARSDASMAGLARACAAAGFETCPIDYPSRDHSIADLTAFVTAEIVARHPGRALHAVTHSLGGIVFRHLQDRRLDWQRAVMIAPPNRGSQIAGALVGNPLFRWFYGPAGRELAGSAEHWPAPPCKFAVVAGTRRFAIANPTSWISQRRFGDADNDGTVAVDETRLDGMSGFRTVDATHTTIMNDPEVQRLAIAFLRDGALPG